MGRGGLLHEGLVQFRFLITFVILLASANRCFLHRTIPTTAAITRMATPPPAVAAAIMTVVLFEVLQPLESTLNSTVRV